MKKLLLLLSLLPACVSAQYVPVAYSSGSTTSNAGFLGQVSNDAASATAVSQSYTCNSTSDRLAIVGIAKSVTPSSLTLSDTGGQAAGATVVMSLTNMAANAFQAWNMGCSASANTITVTEAGAGSTTMVISIQEFSGVGTGGTGTVAAAASPPVYPASGTAAQGGTVGVVVINSNSFQTFFTATTAGWNFSDSNITGNNSGGQVLYPMFYNLNLNSGAVSFTTTGGASPAGQVVLLLIPGTAAPSPNWYPYIAQSNSNCSSGSTISVTMHQNTVAGNAIAVAFGSEATANAPSSITDSLSTVYSLQVTQHVGTSNAIWIYKGVPSSSGANTITANGSGFSFPCLHAAEFNGPVGTVSDTASDNTSSGTMSWTQTVSVANSVVYAACKAFGGTPLQMSGFSFAGLSQNSSGDGNGGSWARTTTTASVSPTFHFSLGSNNICASIVMH